MAAIGPSKVTGDQCVAALKFLKTRVSARAVAAHLGTSPRAVATALRLAYADGRVNVIYKRGLAQYKFARVKPNREVIRNGGFIFGKALPL